MKLEEAKNSILQGDCIEVMKKLPDNSVDSVITDPPYGLSFMGKEWDSYTDNQAFQEWTKRWAKEALRVAKPGAMMLCFGGTRTFHRIACGLEDAGWSIKDTLMYMYGSGFPKSYNISKGIDRKKGHKLNSETGKCICGKDHDFPYTKEAKKWKQQGTNLKPAYEPILVCMAPVEKTFVNNALKWDVAGINIDGCRIEGNPPSRRADTEKFVPETDHKWGSISKRVEYNGNKGRFPTNVIMECTCDEVKEGEVRSDGGTGKAPTNYKLSQNKTGQNYFNYANEDGTETAKIHTDPNCPCYMLDEQSGMTGGDSRKSKSTYDKGFWGNANGSESESLYDDKGGASRFFKQVRPDRFKYTPKASKEERNLGCEMLDTKNYGQSGGARQSLKKGEDEYQKKGEASCGLNTIKKVKNDHPTVKPIDLLKYLCKLTKTPEGGVVIDPFIGSGVTAIACILTDRDYIGIEKEQEYIKIAKARLNYWKKPKHRREAYKKRKKRKKKHSKKNKKLRAFMERRKK